MSDTIIDMDNISSRKCLDAVVNQHSHIFLEFHNDIMMFALNGRFKESDDNFTSVLCKGKSVVDYI